jgi:mono/diheme cytochrome c family protein
LALGNGAVGAGTLFAGTQPDGFAAIPASVYNNLWQAWGFSTRPDNFDQLVAERWGFAFGSEPNPYPKPGEDPNKTQGGTGRLPTAFTQTHNADGSWTGTLGVTCHGCHSSVVGTPDEGPGLGVTSYGAGSSPHDMGLMARDLGLAGQPLYGALSFTSALGRTRGTGDPINVQLIIIETTDLRLNPSTLPFFTAPSPGSEDAPAWWNMGHRPVKFFDGFLSMDADRSDLGLFLPFLDKQPIPSSQTDAQNWVRAHAQDTAVWATSLKSPTYPLPVDTALAEQGAILFHSKNLWADGLNNPVPKPAGGNGSCASCHGAYSPRYSNDSSYLDSPTLEGMAGYLVPLTIIGTDTARSDAINDQVSEYGRGNFYAYPETDGLPSAQDCTPTTRAGLRGDRQPGYLAPPLYGVWATAPYFHNGSVPNAWEVLKPADRQPIWRRVSAPARADQQGSVVMGFDTSLTRAYDSQKLGWKYEALACGVGTNPYLDCDPSAPDSPTAAQDLLAQIYQVVGLTWSIALPPLTNQQAEDRKIYNTHAYSQGNAGHEFTAVLTDQERMAILEYLKTL